MYYLEFIRLFRFIYILYYQNIFSKLEAAFCNGKIFKNEKKIFRKGTAVNVNDEIDIVTGNVVNNSNFVYVSRLKIISIVINKELFQITLEKDKNVLVENKNF